MFANLYVTLIQIVQNYPKSKQETQSGEEYEHTYDPESLPYDPASAFDMGDNPAQNNVQNNVNSLNPNGIHLPPDISELLQNIQQQSIATGGQLLAMNSHIMGNVQNILASITVSSMDLISAQLAMLSLIFASRGSLKFNNLSVLGAFRR